MDSNIHNVEAFTVGPVKGRNIIDGYASFYTREIRVESEDGSVFTLTLFSDNQANLSLKY